MKVVLILYSLSFFVVVDSVRPPVRPKPEMSAFLCFVLFMLALQAQIQNAMQATDCPLLVGSYLFAPNTSSLLSVIYSFDRWSLGFMANLAHTHTRH